MKKSQCSRCLLESTGRPCVPACTMPCIAMCFTAGRWGGSSAARAQRAWGLSHSQRFKPWLCIRMRYLPNSCLVINVKHLILITADVCTVRHRFCARGAKDERWPSPHRTEGFGALSESNTLRTDSLSCVIHLLSIQILYISIHFISIYYSILILSSFHIVSTTEGWLMQLSLPIHVQTCGKWYEVMVHNQKHHMHHSHSYNLAFGTSQIHHLSCEAMALKHVASRIAIACPRAFLAFSSFSSSSHAFWKQRLFRPDLAPIFTLSRSFVLLSSSSTLTHTY